jgi:hypothetical protein
MSKKPYRTNALLEAAVRAGARPATEEEYRAEEGVTSLVFSLPLRDKLRRHRRNGGAR